MLAHLKTLGGIMYHGIMVRVKMDPLCYDKKEQKGPTRVKEGTRCGKRHCGQALASSGQVTHTLH